MIRPRVIALAALSLVAPACGGPKDTTEIGVSTHSQADAGPPKTGYDFVARRTLGSVAMAGAEGFEQAEMRALVEHVADELDRCAATFLKEGHLATGAVRVEGDVAGDGRLAAIDVRVSPGTDATKNAVLCVITPARQFPFSSAKRDAGTKARHFALEAVWQPLGG